jgi:hypothetical protein
MRKAPPVFQYAAGSCRVEYRASHLSKGAANQPGREGGDAKAGTPTSPTALQLSQDATWPGKHWNPGCPDLDLRGRSACGEKWLSNSPSDSPSASDPQQGNVGKPQSLITVFPSDARLFVAPTIFRAIRKCHWPAVVLRSETSSSLRREWSD